MTEALLDELLELVRAMLTAHANGMKRTWGASNDSSTYEYQFIQVKELQGDRSKRHTRTKEDPNETHSQTSDYAPWRVKATTKIHPRKTPLLIRRSFSPVRPLSRVL